MYAFADAFDLVYVIKKDLEAIYCQEIPMTLLTDLKRVFDIITKCSSTSEKLLMVDISVVREVYERQEMCDVGYVRSQFNPSDDFTKLMKPNPLTRIIQDNTCDLPIEQWVIRQVTNYITTI